MLKGPIAEQLRSRFDEAAMARVWRGIRERRHASPLLRPQTLAVAIAAVVLAFLAYRSVAPRAAPVATEAAPAERPLSMQDGTRIGALQLSTASARATWRLSDGSSLAFEGATRWEPLAISGAQMVSTLRHGTVVVDVKPGGPRRWVVECGPVSVEVVGTRFSVFRDSTLVRVFVEHGVVIVRGAPVPDTVQSLTAGQSIEVRLEAAEPALSAVAPPVVAPTASVRATVPVWVTEARRGHYREAYEALAPEGGVSSAERAADADRLLMLADVARLSGHPADAVAPLEKVMNGHPESPAAGLAAVTLGRLLLDQLSQPAQAARPLKRSLSMRIPASLREDVYARLVEAEVRAGQRAELESTLAAYESEFPAGRLHDVVMRNAKATP